MSNKADFTELATARLNLRLTQLDDQNFFTQLYSPVEVASYLGSVPHPLPSGWIQKRMAQMIAFERDGKGASLVIETQSGGQAIGWLSYAISDGIGPNELGFAMMPGQQGQGFVSEAIQGLITHLFDQKSTQSICARVMEDNPASQAVLAKIGMRDIDGATCKSAGRGCSVPARLFQITRNEYDKQQDANHG